VTPNSVLVSDKDIVKLVLVEKDYPKSKWIYGKVRNKFNVEILFSTTDKNTHKKLRRMLSAGFSIKYLDGLEPLMRSCIDPLCDKMDLACEAGEARIDISGILKMTAIDIIGTTALGGSLGAVENGKCDLLDRFYKFVSLQTFSFLPVIGKFFPPPPDKATEAFILDVIKRRRQSDSKHHDILQILLDAQDDENHEFSDKQVMMEVFGLLLAGSETTSNTLSFLLNLLLRNPDKLDILIQELNNAFSNPASEPTLSELKALPYLNAVINETLRMRPVIGASFMPRDVTEDVVIGKNVVPAGTTVWVSLWALHYDKRYWGDDADAFKPERFLTNDWPHDAFYPFSQASRICLGKNFAIMEMRLVLSTLLRRYIFRDDPSQNNNLRQMMTLMFEDRKFHVFAKRRDYGMKQ
jgi:cytochrome P450